LLLKNDYLSVGKVTLHFTSEDQNFVGTKVYRPRAGYTMWKLWFHN